MSHQSMTKEEAVLEWLAQRPDEERPENATLAAEYSRVRAYTDSLVRTLEPEDRVVQSMPDTSPVNWHLAHTSWFFETFVLVPHLKNYCVYDEQFAYLFNSYYESVGPRQPRPRRGLLTRPTSQVISEYRQSVDFQMRKLFATESVDVIEPIIRLGLAHEEQHQELLLTDILHLFAQSPLSPAFRPDWPSASKEPRLNV